MMRCVQALSVAATLSMFGGPANAELTVVTSSRYAPFAAQDWLNGGMVTEIVTRAMALDVNAEPVDILYQGDWSVHLTQTTDGIVDLAFPWPRPDCEAALIPVAKCNGFHFSDPVLELVTLLFTRTSNEFQFEGDADVLGKTLCRPNGLPIYDLERADRQWISTQAITLVQPDTVAECFSRLMAGSVDAVAVNEFLGVKELFAQDLTEKVVPLPRALSIEPLHLIASKTHWRATAHLYRFNSGLAALRQSGEYAEIVERHIALYWQDVR